MDDTAEVLSQMNKLVTTNTKTMSILGAQTMVLGKFFDAAMLQLTDAQRFQVGTSFQRNIEETMSMMDDMPLPADYHSAVLTFTNAILTALDQPSAHRQ